MRAQKEPLQAPDGAGKRSWAPERVTLTVNVLDEAGGARHIVHLSPGRSAAAASSIDPGRSGTSPCPLPARSGSTCSGGAGRSRREARRARWSRAHGAAEGWAGRGASGRLNKRLLGREISPAGHQLRPGRGLSASSWRGGGDSAFCSGRSGAQSGRRAQRTWPGASAKAHRRWSGAAVGAYSFWRGSPPLLLRHGSW